MTPCSTVWITDFYNFSQKIYNYLFLSNFPLYDNPKLLLVLTSSPSKYTSYTICWSRLTFLMLSKVSCHCSMCSLGL
jgi:hypothetical protein